MGGEPELRLALSHLKPHSSSEQTVAESVKIATLIVHWDHGVCLIPLHKTRGWHAKLALPIGDPQSLPTQSPQFQLVRVGDGHPGANLFIFRYNMLQTAVH
jgi:hypothetical protein